MYCLDYNRGVAQHTFAPAGKWSFRTGVDGLRLGALPRLGKASVSLWATSLSVQGVWERRREPSRSRCVLGRGQMEEIGESWSCRLCTSWLVRHRVLGKRGDGSRQGRPRVPTLGRRSQQGRPRPPHWAGWGCQGSSVSEWVYWVSTLATSQTRSHLSLMVTLARHCAHFTDGELRHREIKGPAQGHTVWEGHVLHLCAVEDGYRPDRSLYIRTGKSLDLSHSRGNWGPEMGSDWMVSGHSAWHPRTQWSLLALLLPSTHSLFPPSSPPLVFLLWCHQKEWARQEKGVQGEAFQATLRTQRIGRPPHTWRSPAAGAAWVALLDPQHRRACLCK